MSDDVAIKVEHVSKRYCKSLKRSMLYGIHDIARNMFGLSSHSDRIRPSEFWALDDVSFEVKRGETLGIIGPNGAGKTTMLKLLNGIFWPDKGRVTIKGKVGALIEVGAGFHPLLTGRENIYINGAILGMSKKEINKKFDSIVDFADIGDFLDVPVKNYSSGMYIRLGFAVAVHCSPDIMLIDEILAVGDANFQTKSFQRMSELISSQGCAVVLTSHHMEHIARICSKALFLNYGNTIEYGNTSKVIQSYRSYSSCEEYTGNISDDKLEKVVITGVSIKNDSGIETNEYCSGDKCRIEISYSAVEPIKDPVITISLFSVFDQLHTHYSTKGNLDNISLDGTGLIVLNIHYLGLCWGNGKSASEYLIKTILNPMYGNGSFQK